jgi:methyl-accepting chemotaxis protein
MSSRASVGAGQSRLDGADYSQFKVVLDREEIAAVPTFAVQRLFDPAIVVTSRLAFAWKFVLVGLVVAAPLAYMVSAYLGQEQSQIAFSAKERVGVEFVRPAASLLEALVEARAATVAGDAAGRTAALRRVGVAIRAVEVADASVGGELGLATEWRTLRDQIRAAGGRSYDPRAAYKAYSRLTAATRTLIVDAGNNSNLILDPDLDSFYLMDDAVNKLPLLMDTTGQVADLEVVMASQSAGPGSGVDLADRIALATLRGTVAATLDQTHAGYATAFKSTHDSSLEPALGAGWRRVASTSAPVDAHAGTVVAGASPRASASATGASAVQAAGALERTTLPQLDRLLAVRLAGLESAKRDVIWIVVAATLLSVYLFVGFALAVRRSIAAVRSGVEAIATGDVDQIERALGAMAAEGDLTIAVVATATPVEIVGQDEVAQLGRTFNTMLANVHSMIDAYNSMRVRTAELGRVAGQISQGELDSTIERLSDRDEFGAAFVAMQAYLREVADAAKAVSQGDICSSVAPRSDKDVLGTAFVDMHGYLSEMVTAAEQIACRDLTGKATPRSDRDALAHAFNQMTENISTLIGEVARATGRLTQASHQMLASSTEAGRSVEEIANAVADVAAGSERQARMLDDTRTSAGQTANAAAETSRVAADGVEAAAEASAAMQWVVDSAREVDRAMTSLTDRSHEITSIIETISSIAAQTNLLALNAAVEAARAGEQGRGFAVVAEEVRKLAEGSKSAAETISTLIAEIQSETRRAADAVAASAERTGTGVSTVGRTREAFEAIGEAVADITGRVDTISDATNEIASVAEESSAAAEQVSASTEETAATAQQLAGSAQELTATASHLDRLLGQFTLNDEANCADQD